MPPQYDVGMAYVLCPVPCTGKSGYTSPVGCNMTCGMCLSFAEEQKEGCAPLCIAGVCGPLCDIILVGAWLGTGCMCCYDPPCAVRKVNSYFVDSGFPLTEDEDVPFSIRAASAARPAAASRRQTWKTHSFPPC
jgi:hypothetical protein